MTDHELYKDCSRKVLLRLILAKDALCKLTSMCSEVSDDLAVAFQVSRTGFIAYAELLVKSLTRGRLDGAMLRQMKILIHTLSLNLEACSILVLKEMKDNQSFCKTWNEFLECVTGIMDAYNVLVVRENDTSTE